MKRSLVLVLLATAVVLVVFEGRTTATLRFIDRFEYAASRSDVNTPNIFVQHGWSQAKSEQTESGANGFLYTTTSIPGFTGTFPGTGSRVLAMEALPGTQNGQTDFYLEFGGAANAIPGDVWLQFWMYPQDSGTQRSRYGTRNKFLYMCNDAYPCHSHLWMVGQGSLSYMPNDPLPIGDPSNGEFFFNLSSASGVSTINNSLNPDSSSELGMSNLNEWMKRNRWTLVKMHMKTTATSGNSFEVWLRPYGASWVKVSEWIGGTTPGFTWGVPSGSVGGHRTLRMPSTVGKPTDQWYDYWLYMDDFAISSTEQDLPVYADDPTNPLPTAPTNLRIVGTALFERAWFLIRPAGLEAMKATQAR